MDDNGYVLPRIRHGAKVIRDKDEPEGSGRVVLDLEQYVEDQCIGTLSVVGDLETVAAASERMHRVHSLWRQILAELGFERANASDAN